MYCYSSYYTDIYHLLSQGQGYNIVVVSIYYVVT